MKEEIKQILSIIPLDIRLPWKKRFENHNEAAKQLEQLICNEVVKAYLISQENELETWWHGILSKHYSETTIKIAIEKYKEENKCG